MVGRRGTDRELRESASAPEANCAMDREAAARLRFPGFGPISAGAIERFPFLGEAEMHMKKLLLPLCVGVCALCGCAQSYVMNLSNGTQIVTPSKPRLKGSNYVYKDASGRQQAVPQSRVLLIEPASMAKKEQRFNTQNPQKR